MLEISCCHDLCDVSSLKGKKKEREKAAGGAGGVLRVSSTVKAERLTWDLAILLTLSQTTSPFSCLSGIAS